MRERVTGAWERDIATAGGRVTNIRDLEKDQIDGPHLVIHNHRNAINKSAALFHLISIPPEPTRLFHYVQSQDVCRRRFSFTVVAVLTCISPAKAPNMAVATT